MNVSFYVRVWFGKHFMIECYDDLFGKHFMIDCYDDL